MKKTNKKGFTLVELVIVIAVIAILAGVLIGTFASVISRANQSKAVQEWKARVDEAYVEYVAENHKAPTHVVVNKMNKTILFADSTTETAGKVELATLYSQVNTYYTLAQKGYYFSLDDTNKVYLLWNEDGESSTYLVVAINDSSTDATLTGLYVKDDTLYVNATGYKQLTYNGTQYVTRV